MERKYIFYFLQEIVFFKPDATFHSNILWQASNWG